MNKRQRKKQEKKYLPIIADEGNLLTMTPRERMKAWSDYKKFREKYARKKRKKDLKEYESLRYYFPVGEEYANTINKLNKLSMNKENYLLIHYN